MSVFSLFTYVFYLAALFASALALWKGDQPLRMAAVATIISWSLTPLIDYWDPDHVNLVATTVDGLTTTAYIWISMRWRRLWSVALSASGILLVLCPLVYAVDHRVHAAGWIAVNNILAVAQLAILLVATQLAFLARNRVRESAVRTFEQDAA